jgi:hypothetical protein
MSTATAIALIAGAFSLMTSLLTLTMQQWDRRAAQRHADEAARRDEVQRERVLRLEAELAGRGRERDAQRDYEYEARKRLYAEVQPMFFHLGEAASATFDCIRHLQGFRAFRMMQDVNAALTVNNVYRLMAPLATVRLIQRRLTAVDLRLDAALRAQYRLARELLYTFSRGERVAALAPAIEYTWTGEDRQHLVPAVLEVVAAGLTVEDAGGSARCMTYPEFEACFRADQSLRDTTLPVRRWLAGASPTAKPVLWRLLVAQAYLVHALTDMIANGTAGPQSIAPPLAERRFNWKTKNDDLPVELTAESARAAAEDYLRTCLSVADAILPTG